MRPVGSTWFGPADVVADHLGRVGAEEDRAGVADALGQRLGARDRAARGARAPGDRPARRASSRSGTTTIAPKSRQLARAIAWRGSVASWRSTARGDRIGERRRRR